MMVSKGRDVIRHFSELAQAIGRNVLESAACANVAGVARIAITPRVADVPERTEPNRLKC